MSALRAATKLIGREPSGNPAHGGANPQSVDRSNRATSYADLCAIIGTDTSDCCRSGPACHETLFVVVVEDVFALRANNVGHKVVI